MACVDRRRRGHPPGGRHAAARRPLTGDELMTTTVWSSLAGALMPYPSRVGAQRVLWRFDKVHPRVEPGLNAVPAAVLTTLVAPAAMSGGPAEIIALVAAGAVALFWGGMMPMFLTGAA